MSLSREDPRWEHTVALRSAIRWIDRHIATTRGLSPEQVVGATVARGGIGIVLLAAGVDRDWTPVVLDRICAESLREAVDAAGRGLVEGIEQVCQGSLAAGLVQARDGIDRMLAPPREEEEGR